MIKLDIRDEDVLVRILELCDRITAARARYGDDPEAFDADPDYQDVVCMNLFQIGEISHSLSDEVKEELSELPWPQIYGIRNIIAHAYVIVQRERIWNTIIEDIPAMRRTVAAALGRES